VVVYVGVAVTTTNATIFDCPKFQSAMFNTPVGVTVGDAIGEFVGVGEIVIVKVDVGDHVGVQVCDCAGPPSISMAHP